MKKIIFLLGLIASLCCVSCSSNVKHARELIDEYAQKENQLYNEVNGMDVFFTDEEEAYIEAEAMARAYQTKAVMSEDWGLDDDEFEYEAFRMIVRSENLRVKLTEEQRIFAQMYWDMCIYHAKTVILEDWLKEHGK